MKKRIISLLMALVMFGALPVMSARVFADGDYIEYTVGKETMRIICEKNGLDYDFCKAAIIKLNSEFSTEEDFSKNLTYGMTIKIPKTNADAAKIRGVALPSDVPASGTPSSGSSSGASGNYVEYKVKNNDTMIAICKEKGLDFDKCKEAIKKLNNYTSDYSFLTMKTGDVVKLPKSNADAAAIVSAASTTTGTTTTGTTTTGTATTLTGKDYVAAYMVPYTVKAGETLFGICAANNIDYSRYGNLIVQASGLKSADRIHSGDVLYLPSNSSSGNAFTIVAHTVQAGETTYGICQTLGIDYSARLNMIAALNPGKNLSAIYQNQLLLFPSGKGGAAAGTAAGTTGAASGYVPAAAAGTTGTAATPVAATAQAKVGVNFYLKEITIKKNDTVYDLVKAAGFDYTTYYADVLLAFNNLGGFGNLKEGDKLLMLSKTSDGAKYMIKGYEVKNGDTTIKICGDAKVDFNANQNLIARLNPSLNISNIRVGNILLLPHVL